MIAALSPLAQVVVGSYLAGVLSAFVAATFGVRAVGELVRKGGDSK